MASTFEVQATPSDEIALEEWRRWYDSIWERAQAINGKAGVLLAFQGATILVLLGDPASFLSKLKTALWWVQGLAALDGTFFLGSVIFSMLTLVSYGFPYPNSDEFVKALGEKQCDVSTGKQDDEQNNESFNFLDGWKYVSRRVFVENLLVNYPGEIRTSRESLIKKNTQYWIALGLTIGFAVLLLVTAILVYWG